MSNSRSRSRRRRRRKRGRGEGEGETEPPPNHWPTVVYYVGPLYWSFWSIRRQQLGMNFLFLFLCLAVQIYGVVLYECMVIGIGIWSAGTTDPLTLFPLTHLIPSPPLSFQLNSVSFSIYTPRPAEKTYVTARRCGFKGPTCFDLKYQAGRKLFRKVNQVNIFKKEKLNRNSDKFHNQVSNIYANGCFKVNSRIWN